MGFGIRYATSSPYWQYYYFGKNIQGDVIALYRSDYNSSSQSYYPTLVATYSYDPWGMPTGIYDANGNSISQTAYHVAAYNPFRYRGYRYDGDTRLYYLQSRYYDPAIGRFINADSPNFALTNPYSNGITDKNYFAYCDNNPINRNDDGGEFWNIVVGAVAGGIISCASTVYDCVKSGDGIGSTIKQALVSTACGAIGGAIAGSGLGVVGQAVAGGILSGVEDAARQGIRTGRVNVKSSLKAAAIGAVSGLIGGKGAAKDSKYIAFQVNTARNKTAKYGWRVGLKYLKRNTWNWSKKNLTKSTLSGIFRSTIANKSLSLMHR